jgi:hypothetical protein
MAFCLLSQVIAVTLVTWSIAELIRYSFYAFNTVDPKLVPFPILWLRYSGATLTACSVYIASHCAHILAHTRTRLCAHVRHPSTKRIFARACARARRTHTHTGFIVLYPVGVAGEMISAYLTLPLLKKNMCPTFDGLRGQECPSNVETLLYVFLFQVSLCLSVICARLCLSVCLAVSHVTHTHTQTV